MQLPAGGPEASAAVGPDCKGINSMNDLEMGSSPFYELMPSQVQVQCTVKGGH